jgi:poly(3-hydroxybutyrate) depolymerase
MGGHLFGRTGTVSQILTMLKYLIIILFHLVCCSSAVAGEYEFEYINTFDSTLQKAIAYVPAEYSDVSSHPLLVVAHYMGGNRFTASRQGYYEACERRNWLLVCPELHGRNTAGETSLAALEAQHDVSGAINYMQSNYHVDTTRIFMAGRSMGGMLAQIMAAKYPDLFAAVVAGQGISDLKLWMDTTIPRLREMAFPETGPYSQNRFEFHRRSSVNFARNYRYVPLILWHGSNDTWVPPEQTSLLQKAIEIFNPYQAEVVWLQGAAHAPRNFTAEWVCDRFTYYQNVPELGMDLPHRFFPELDLVTDEAKWFFWLYIRPDREDRFAEVKITLSDSLMVSYTKNVAGLMIDLDLIPYEYRPGSIHSQSRENITFNLMKGGTRLLEFHLEEGRSIVPDREILNVD